MKPLGRRFRGKEEIKRRKKKQQAQKDRIEKKGRKETRLAIEGRFTRIEGVISCKLVINFIKANDQQDPHHDVDPYLAINMSTTNGTGFSMGPSSNHHYDGGGGAGGGGVGDL